MRRSRTRSYQWPPGWTWLSLAYCGGAENAFGANSADAEFGRPTLGLMGEGITWLGGPINGTASGVDGCFGVGI